MCVCVVGDSRGNYVIFEVAILVFILFTCLMLNTVDI